jgi:hypothetical protein
MYIVMIQNAWGKAESIIEAANIARRQIGRRASQSLPKPRIVFQYDPAKTTKAYVDDMGSLCWFGERPVTIEKVGFSS